MLQRIVSIFTSLRLTVICLAFAVALVFLGSLAQVEEGLYQAQNRWFRSFFIWWGPGGAPWKVPVFPGGYLIGAVLLVNLLAAHFKRFQLTWSKFGIHMTHLGIILLLAGQLATDLLSNETVLDFMKGETKHYSESAHHNELVFLADSTAPGHDEIVSIPEQFLRRGEIRSEKLPFAIRVGQYHINADIRGRQIVPLPEERDPAKVNMPSAVIELIGSAGPIGTMMVSTMLRPQEVDFGGKLWRVALRPQRRNLPFSLKLLETKFDVYPGSETPKNFQSRVLVQNPSRGENREVDIYMNNPLRYEGLTFYQFQMGSREDIGRNSALQVVKNPSWLTPYLGCIMVGAGMSIQFLMHLRKFISKRRTS